MKDDETPLFKQYFSLKAQHSEAILFFRLGDFYEMFDEDAIEVSRLLSLTLTKRCEHPMCGIPFRAVKRYAAKLLSLGKKIAVCEQGEKEGKNAIQSRQITEIITPGTAIDEAFLDGSDNNFIVACCIVGDEISLSCIDASTGDFSCTSFPASDGDYFAREMMRISASEILHSENIEGIASFSAARQMLQSALFSRYQNWFFDLRSGWERLLRHFRVVNLAAFGLSPASPEIASAGMLLDYVEKNMGADLSHVRTLKKYSKNDFVRLDEAALRNLEIVANLRDGGKSFTLLATLDDCKTGMGKRFLRNAVCCPLRNAAEIRARQDFVQVFFDDRNLRDNAAEILGSILDIERIAAKVAMGKAHARNLTALRQSLKAFVELNGIAKMQCQAETAERLFALLQSAILDEPSTALNEGNLIKAGFDAELDRTRKIQTDFQTVLDEYAEEERQKTGIPSLKIRYNRANGYYIEISRSKADAIPEHFIRRRSLLNADRFTTERLRQLEAELVGAAEKIIGLEHAIFMRVRDEVAAELPYLLQISAEIAKVDFYRALANVAKRCGWHRPTVDDSGDFEIRAGRHPVVEMTLPSGEFVPNDLSLTEKTFALITGPNMAGKSTFLRQNALIALLAHMGSFVPAEFAKIGIVEQIFCRVGAQDNLANGESTFLVEMSETAKILRTATKRSLVLMDEIGRGTSTEDGLSIAWAVAEFLLDKIGAKTLFATHYHELTRLRHDALSMLCPDVVEENGEITFTRKMREGASENSYGIHVARLAGIPDEVIERAGELLGGFHEERPGLDAKPTKTLAAKRKIEVPSLFSERDMVLGEISACDCDKITPLQALQFIFDWKRRLE